MIAQDEEHYSNIFHMGEFSPLVEIIDAQQGYCLLKNHCPFGDRWYSVGIILEDKTPHMAMNDTDECWLKHDQADEVMRKTLGKKSYNKASKNYFNSIQE